MLESTIGLNRWDTPPNTGPNGDRPIPSCSISSALSGDTIDTEYCGQISIMEHISDHDEGGVAAEAPIPNQEGLKDNDIFSVDIQVLSVSREETSLSGQGNNFI